MEIIAAPAIEYHPAQGYLAIREITPFRGMLSARDRLWNELFTWLEDHGIRAFGPAFLRLHVVDMKGDMDLEAGVMTSAALEGDGRVHAGQLPVGDYATLTYRNHAIRANRYLIGWTAEQGLQFDRRREADGDHFACRYELNLSDPHVDKCKTQWLVQLNFLIRSDQRPMA